MPFVIEMNGIVRAETSITVTFAATIEKSVHAIQAEISEAVGFNEPSDLFHGAGGSDQFAACRSIDTIVAGTYGWRGTDAHVYFSCARVPQHPNNFSARRSAHDRVVYNNHSLSLKHFPLRVELDFYAEVTNGLLRFDKRTA